MPAVPCTNQFRLCHTRTRALSVRARASETTAAKMTPTVTYFPIKALGETIRLCLAAAGQEFINEAPDKEAMKADLDIYCFGQVPRYRDGEVDLVQSHAIIRHLGRKHDMYGSSPVEMALVDQLMDGCGDMRPKVMPLLYYDSMQTDEARQAHWDAHVAPEAARGACKGAHNLFLQNQIQKHGKDGFAVGSKLTIVDLYLFDLTDAHHRVFGAEKFDAVYPALAAHHSKIGALPAVAAYLASPLCYAR